jgi:TRAP-type transport system periplasmic protein
MTRSVRTGLVVAAAALACLAPPASAERVTLKFATVDSPYALVNIHIHHPWAERVSAAGKDVLRIEVVDGPKGADFANVYHRVLDDDVQIGWALQPYLSVAFPLTEVAALPLVADSAEDASVALYRLWKSGALDSEYGEIVPLKFCTTSQEGLHLRSVPSSNEGFAGLKIIQAGRIGGDTIAALGATPVSLGLAEYRPALVAGAADGVLAGWPILEPLGLNHVTTFHVEVALGGTPCMVFMARKRYLALPAVARRVLDARSREHEARMLGRFWDGAAREGRVAINHDKGQEVVVPAPPQLALFQKRVAPAIAAWEGRTKGGAEILAKFRATVAAIASER